MQMKDGQTHLMCKGKHVVDLNTQIVLTAQTYPEA